MYGRGKKRGGVGREKREGEQERSGREECKESGVGMIDGEREKKGHGERRDGWK